MFELARAFALGNSKYVITVLERHRQTHEQTVTDSRTDDIDLLWHKRALERI